MLSECRGEVGRRRPLLLRPILWDVVGKACVVGSRMGAGRGCMSSSEFSAMSSIKEGAKVVGRASSKDRRGLDRAAGGGRRGLEGRTGECEGERPLARDSYIGRERALAIGGADNDGAAE